jgi:hypothetical protein
VASLEGDNFVVIISEYNSFPLIMPPLISKVASSSGDNLEVFRYLNASEIWPDKR